jgi:hypothetical protein
MRRWSLLAALLLLAQAGTYRIHVALSPDVGQSIKAATEVRIKQEVSIRDGAGKLRNAYTKERVNVDEWTGTTIRRAGENATFRRTWTKVESESGGKRTFSPLQGQTATFIVRGEKVGMMSSDGLPITEEARQNLELVERSELRAEANNMCVPATPLSIGSTWTIPGDQARDCFTEVAVVAGPVTATGKLTSADSGYATIDFKYAMKLAAIGAGAEFVTPAPLDGTVRLRVSLKDPLDWTATKSMHLVGTIRPAGQSESSTMDMHSTTVTRFARR